MQGFLGARVVSLEHDYSHILLVQQIPRKSQDEGKGVTLNVWTCRAAHVHTGEEIDEDHLENYLP